MISQITDAINEYNNSRYDAARALSLQIISIDRNNYYGNYVYGSSECALGNIEVGVKSLARCLTHGHDTFEVFNIICTFIYSHVQSTDYKVSESLRRTVISMVQTAVAFDPANPSIYYRAANSLFISGQHDTVAWYLRIASIIDPSDVKYWLALGDIYSKKKRFSNVAKAEKCYLNALALGPKSVEAHMGLGLTRFWQAKDEHAVVSLQRVLALDPSTPGIQKTLQEIEAHATPAPGSSGATASPPAVSVSDPSRPKLVRYPKQISELKSIREAVRTHFLKGYNVKEKLDRASSLTVTFGSCFANSISIALNERNIETAYITVGEVVNTTFANNFFLDWVIDGVTDSSIQRVHEFSEMKKEDIIEKLRRADMVIYTLGVAWAFFEKNTGKFVMPKSSAITMSAMATKFDFRLTTVEENKNNIIKIFKKIRTINPYCAITFTLSPVPLQANFAGMPPFEADCLSKSTLRLALQDALKAAEQQGIEQIYYWPSFEIVRWLSPYLIPPFGVEDGSTIHVSEEVVDSITDGFIRVFYTDDPQEQAAP